MNAQLRPALVASLGLGLFLAGACRSSGAGDLGPVDQWGEGTGNQDGTGPDDTGDPSEGGGGESGGEGGSSDGGASDGGTDGGGTGGDEGGGDEGGGDEGGEEATWWELGHTIADAEYDYVNDLVVTVSADDRALYVIDPATGSVDAVALNVDPVVVSVSPSGGEAVVGHDGWVSVVDLLSLSLSDTIACSVEVFDIVHGGNDMAYLFPLSGQWVDLTSLDLLTGEEHTDRSIRHYTRAKLHPDGEKIYGADNGLSPDDIERYDIGADGVAEISYDSPYHGDYDFDGNLWLGHAGSRIFTHSGNVFRSTDDVDKDMTYAGSLAGLGDVTWVDTVELIDRVYAVDEGSPGTVHAYDHAYLASQGSLTLPLHEVSGTSYGLTVTWLFAAQDGSEVHLIGELPGSSGALLPWTFATLATGDLP